MALEDIGIKRVNLGEVQLNTLGKVFEHYGQLFVDATKRQLEQSGDNASFRLMQSIAFDIEIIGLKYRFTISMADYWEWVDKGRGPGKRPPLKPLIDWIFYKPDFKAKLGATRKGVKDMKPAKLGDIVAPKPILRAALGMQRNIGIRGTKGSGFFSNVVNSKSLEYLQADLSAAIGKDVEITIQEIANEINKK